MQQAPLLQTKLYLPPVRAEWVSRPRLIERLNAGLDRKLTLVSAPAGFGKTTLVSEWVQATDTKGTPAAVAWLSLDRDDNDPARFMAYMISALRTIKLRQVQDGDIGKGMLSALQSPQPPPTQTVLTSLVNELAIMSDRILLVLDDYHLIEAQAIHDALTFLLEHLPPQMHLVIATREDPMFSLSRLRVQGQLTEVRAAELRFSLEEAAEFLNRVMGLDLSAKDVAALEARTEGWIAGLQLAALALQGTLTRTGAGSGQGRQDASSLINSFSGSHRFVLDYLVEEVLQQQSETIHTFLLQTAILDRLTGPLCDAVRFGESELPQGKDSGQTILEALDRANLFVVPLDNERRWYRYHHLFADLLRQRLHQEAASSPGDGERDVAELHSRASVWFEDNGLEIEAFHHATAANDTKRAARLIEGGGMPLTFRGAVAPVLNWLDSLPATELDAEPLLWVTYATTLLAIGQGAGVEPKLQAAEAALRDVELDDRTRDLIGRIAATRATLAWGLNKPELIIAQSRRAMEYLHPDNLPFRTSTTWKLGTAYQMQGERAEASQAYLETIATCEATGNVFINIMASTCLGQVQESENQLYRAAETYRRILHLVGDLPLLAACGAYLGLACISYEWNDLDAAQQHGQQCLELGRQIDSNDAFARCSLFLARLNLARGDVAGAAANLADAGEFVRQHSFTHRMPDVAAVQVRLSLHQGNLAEAAVLAQTHNLPISQARVHLARGDAPAALEVLEPWLGHVEAKDWKDERLKALVLQSMAYQMQGEKDRAMQLLGEALALAEPGGFVRTFVDAGPPMARLLREAQRKGLAVEPIAQILSAFAGTDRGPQAPQPAPRRQPAMVRSAPALIERLSERELEVLQLVAEGLTNREIATRLFLSLNTVKVHTRNIYGKLGINSRTKAVARARDLGVLPLA